MRWLLLCARSLAHPLAFCEWFEWLAACAFEKKKKSKTKPNVYSLHKDYYGDLLRWILGRVQLELGNCEADWMFSMLDSSSECLHSQKKFLLASLCHWFVLFCLFFSLYLSFVLFIFCVSANGVTVLKTQPLITLFSWLFFVETSWDTIATTTTMMTMTTMSNWNIRQLPNMAVSMRH